MTAFGRPGFDDHVAAVYPVTGGGGFGGVGFGLGLGLGVGLGFGGVGSSGCGLTGVGCTTTVSPASPQVVATLALFASPE